jgi:hypothetical protein
VVAAAANFSLNCWNPPNVLSIARARFPTGLPPARGPRISQNSAWLCAPPPLLRTTVLISSGTIAMFFASTS